MAEMLITGLLVVGCAPAFLAAEPGWDAVRFALRVGRRLLLSLERVEALGQRRQTMYDSWSRLAETHPGAAESSDH